MDVTVKKLKEDSENEYEDFTEEQIINSMVPIWKKNKSELTPEDYEKFYIEKHYGFDKPLKQCISVSMEPFDIMRFYIFQKKLLLTTIQRNMKRA